MAKDKPGDDLGAENLKLAKKADDLAAENAKLTKANDDLLALLEAAGAEKTRLMTVLEGSYRLHRVFLRKVAAGPGVKAEVAEFVRLHVLPVLGQPRADEIDAAL